MNITRAKAANTITLEGEGVVDNGNYKQLEEALNRELQGNVSMLVIDFGKAEYISSLGLRTLYNTMGQIKAKNKHMVLKNVGGAVMEMFDITGFSGIFNII